MMRGAWRRIFFFLLLSVFCLLLLLTMSRGDVPGEQEIMVRVEKDLNASSMGGGGWEGQRLSRMGSRPPCCGCERRCGGCAPCTAVQVRAAVGPQCAGYEPVRWKCRCGDAVFDP